MSSPCTSPTTTTVHLTIYDLLPASSNNSFLPNLNQTLHPLGLGLFHTGIHLTYHNTPHSPTSIEYSYGATTEPTHSGIFPCTPHECPNVQYRTSIYLGECLWDKKVIEYVVKMMGHGEWKGCRYDVLWRNCQVFCKVFGEWLIGGDVSDKWPGWVDRVAGIGRGVWSCVGGSVEGTEIGLGIMRESRMGKGWKEVGECRGRRWFVRRWEDEEEENEEEKENEEEEEDDECWCASEEENGQKCVLKKKNLRRLEWLNVVVNKHLPKQALLVNFGELVKRPEKVALDERSLASSESWVSARSSLDEWYGRNEC